MLETNDFFLLYNNLFIYTKYFVHSYTVDVVFTLSYYRCLLLSPNTGGLVYKCTRCHHMGPKAQMSAHVVEAHLPQEDVPFWCGICSKRFYLADHHKRRHTEEEFLSTKSTFELRKRDATQQSWEVSEAY